MVLVYSGGASGKEFMDVSIPSTIQTGKHYNNEHSTLDFRGEGLQEGTNYKARIVTKDIDRKNGSDQNSKTSLVAKVEVKNGILKARVNGARKFTTVEFTSTR